MGTVFAAKKRTALRVFFFSFLLFSLIEIYYYTYFYVGNVNENFCSLLSIVITIIIHIIISSSSSIFRLFKFKTTSPVDTST